MSKRSHSSPAFAWRNQTRRRPAARRRPGRAAASAPRPRPRGCPAAGRRETGRGRRSAPGRARREVAAAEHRRHAGGRAPDDRQGEQRRGARRERAVGVEQRRPVQAGPGRDLGHRGLGGGALDPAGPAAVDEPQRRHGPHRGDDLGAARRQLAGGAACMAAIAAPASAPACPAAGRRGPRSAPRSSSARRARAPAARRRRAPAPRPPPGVCTGERLAPIRTRPPSGRQPASTSRQTRTGALRGRARRADQVEVRDAVDHHRDLLARAAARAARAARAGRRSGRRRRGRRGRGRRATAPRAA